MNLENAIQLLDVFIEKNTMYMARHEEMLEAWKEVKKSIKSKMVSSIGTEVKVGDIRSDQGDIYVVTSINGTTADVLFSNGSLLDFETVYLEKDKLISRHSNFYDSIAEMRELNDANGFNEMIMKKFMEVN